ncbi:DUF4320 family protein [Paenibacillus graminis]|uniref:DUF4320 family protein n=1 Tax=Paenibacillus graminis TaxID=189425 RepID=UPI002DBF3990|nr:DUF4320 family protein [Paenibacillus graminis]MEC0167369.1 DUF4320 family protein [Paenibacillus graminis]
MLIAIIIGAVAGSIVQSVTIRNNLRTASNEVLQIMKVENGADYATRQQFNMLLAKMGMDPSKVSFEATPKPLQRGDLVEVTVSYPYRVFALKLVGSDYTVPITVHVSGLAHKYIRTEGS